MSVILQRLVDFVYPRSCAICGKEGQFLCQECWNNLNYAEQICPECGEGSVMGWTHKVCLKKNGLDGLIAVYDYGDEKVRKVIQEIKFGFNQELLRELMNGLVLQWGEKFEGVVPIPLFSYRENWRGFNQAQIMAEEIESRTGIETIKALRRVKNTAQQAREQSRQDRFENLKNAFKVREEINLKGKTLLLVDDVFTTGASMKEAVKSLKKAGAKTVWGLVLAH